MNKSAKNQGFSEAQIKKYGKMKAKILLEMKTVFKIPAVAFAALDFEGKGYIEEEDFYHTLLNYKLPYTKEELKEFLLFDKMFLRSPNWKMDFEGFKKAFFPKSQGIN